MKYMKYDASFKIAAIEEYYELKDKDSISIRSYAKSKGISHATFYKWLSIYEEKRNGIFADDQGSISLSYENDDDLPSFIRVSAEDINKKKEFPVSEYEVSDRSGTLRLLYKDMAIEFDKKDLPFILRSIRQ